MAAATLMQVLKTSGYLTLVLLCVCSRISAFSVSLPEGDELLDLENEVYPSITDDDEYVVQESPDEQPENYEGDHVDQYVDLFKRYTRGWGHQTRYPWKRLPNTMCYRQPCRYNKHCCREFNLCDPSAHVCIDCWYGSKCESERECCERFPICARTWRRDETSRHRYIVSGKCVNKV